MGFFDFLKPKKNDSKEFSSLLSQMPLMNKMVFKQDFEYLDKQIESLALLSRKDEIEKATARYLAKYTANYPSPLLSSEELAGLCYGIAYIYLPNIVFNEWKKFQARWHGAMPYPTYLAINCALMQEKRLSANQIAGFNAYEGKLNDRIVFYAIEFPKPRLQSSSGSTFSNQILAPHFVVILNNAKQLFYVLGQSLDNRTTFRSVVLEGGMKNSNLGQGPKPNIEDLIAFIQERIKRADA